MKSGVRVRCAGWRLAGVGSESLRRAVSVEAGALSLRSGRTAREHSVY
jgi:hypothetical protein